MKLRELIAEASLYPKGYNDYSGGVDWTQEDFDKYIRECIWLAAKKIDENNREAFSSISTGSTKVIVEVYAQDDNKFMIFINICKNREQMLVSNVEL